MSIKPFLQELEEGHDEITDKESEDAGLQILNSESSFISKSSFVSKSAANSSQKQQVIENPSIIETVNKGMEKLLIAVNDLSQHVKGDAGRSKGVERNSRMSNDLADIATKWDKIDNIILILVNRSLKFAFYPALMEWVDLLLDVKHVIST